MTFHFLLSKSFMSYLTLGFSICFLLLLVFNLLFEIPFLKSALQIITNRDEFVL